MSANGNEAERPARVEQCIRSVRGLKPDMSEMTAEAFCGDLWDRGVLQGGDGGDATDPFGDSDGDDEDMELAALAEFRNPGRIQRVESDGGVWYKNVMVLAEGAWTDAGSRSTAIYEGEAIRRSAGNWVDPRTQRPVDEAPVNLMHGPALHGAKSFGDVGHIPTETITVDDENRLFADIFCHGNTPASELAIELMDEVLSAANDPNQEAPPVGPSVEITEEDGHTDAETGVKKLSEMWFSGLGIVFNPASRPVEMENQVRERAVAMADAAGVEHQGVVVRSQEGDGDGDSGEQSLKTRLRHRWLMADSETEETEELSVEDIPRALKAMEETFEEIKRTLQDDDEMAAVQDLISQYAEADGDLSAPATEFVAWVEENTDLGAGDIQGVLDAYLDDVDADGLEEAPTEGLLNWIQEQAGGEDPEGDEEGGEGEEMDESAMEDLQAAVDTIGQYASELESVKDMLTEYREETNETIEEFERRLSKFEDEPQQRSLSKDEDGKFIDLDEAEEEYAPAGPPSL